ncbi:MAG TPA: hypothetical protein VM100_02300 [Longimicrobiales bacterium]|nr:hypothetical protein [Longimicrobiales bacterium]
MKIGMLMRGEMIKAWNRFAIVAFTVTVALTALIVVLPDFIMHRRNAENPAVTFPGVWAVLIRQPAAICLMIVAVVTVLIVASEFMWRTARQNVIDGLSKDQWFVAKYLTSLFFGVLFLLIILTVGAAIAALSPFASFIRAVDLRMIGYYAIALIGIITIAFFLAIVIRRDGGALGVFLLWQGLGEPLVALAFEKMHKGWGRILYYMPLHTISANMDQRYWDPNGARAMMGGMRRPPGITDGTFFPSFSTNLSLTVGYILLFLFLGYWNFKSRDL